MNLRDHKLDSIIFLVVLVLLSIGVVMVYSASSFKALEMHGDSNYFLKRHFPKVLLGLVLMVLVSKINYRFWLRISPALLIIAIAALFFLLISPNVPTIRGSKRWLFFAGFQMQPSDFARLALILFLSWSLTRPRLVGGEPLTHFLFHLFIIILVVVPIMQQPDIGTSLLIAAIAVALLFIAGERLRHLFAFGSTAILFALVFFKWSGYQIERLKKFILSFQTDFVDWQAQQSLIALGNGNIFGLGLGGSRQKYHFLPDPYTDFVYAIVGEELGLVGTTLILALLLLFLWCGFKIAVNAPDRQGKVLANGIVIAIGIYAFTNMGVVVNLLPTTGVPMPFLSYGGSAMMINLFSVGVLLNIATQIHESKLIRPVKNFYYRGNPARRRG